MLFFISSRIDRVFLCVKIYPYEFLLMNFARNLSAFRYYVGNSITLILDIKRLNFYLNYVIRTEGPHIELTQLFISILADNKSFIREVI